MSRNATIAATCENAGDTLKALSSKIDENPEVEFDKLEELADEIEEKVDELKGLVNDAVE